MPIISIPTSIGGVSIPGGLIKGPLSALFANKFGAGSLQYPRDLGSATRGHTIQFFINETDPAVYEEIAKTELRLPSDFSVNELKNFATKAEDVFDKISSKVNLSLKSPKKRVADTIALYMPDTVNFGQQSSYNNLSLKDTIEDTAVGLTGKVPVVGSAVSGGIDAINSKAVKLGLSTQGLAINPQQQLLFEGIDFREFTLSFVFTPYSKDEAETVKKIIQTFRKHAAPRITTGAAGMFFIPPSSVEMLFLFNGKVNNNISSVAECVITGIDVNYAPNGWSAHSDGAPVQTTLTMNFKEIVLLDRTQIENGY